ncbi:hypothetical protein ES703_66995 [subsurface metagenome]
MPFFGAGVVEVKAFTPEPLRGTTTGVTNRANRAIYIVRGVKRTLADS